MRQNLFALSLGFALCALATLAYAMPSSFENCAARKTVIHKLEEKYGETLQSLGVVRDDGYLEIYASDVTGSWSILLTRASGQTCLIASGTDFHMISANPKKTGQNA